MNAKDVMKQAVEASHMLTGAYVGDLTDAELLVRAVPNSNHIAWQLGHLIVGAGHMMKEMGHTPPELPPGFADAYTKETSTSDDPRKFAGKQQLLSLLQAAKTATLAAIDATPDADLDKPGPESFRAYAPTVGASLLILATHPMMHVGQFVPVRRKLGKPPLF